MSCLDLISRSNLVQHQVSITVTLCLVDECREGYLSHCLSRLMCLPRRWQKHTLFLYAGTDSRFWRIEEHVRIDEVEQLVLQMEDQIGRSTHSVAKPMHPQ
ncbi:uncharacterized protein LOC121139255 isoform X2 [Mesocricetus auratus]|uniref:Uncharacterized protein LOC121139255 isoform X2 n=1 Tax=Mesocricetus auratus TaxID=10036 RepID=A0ABM2X6R2_MESAU|nr:uncharacterized protein LOC121139255 isoform X2 [Mesocricetus auratus]